MNEVAGASETLLAFGRGDTTSKIKENLVKVTVNGPSTSLHLE